MACGKNEFLRQLSKRCRAFLSDILSNIPNFYFTGTALFLTTNQLGSIMKIVVRYVKAELDAIVEMVYRFNRSLYGHEIGARPVLEASDLAYIRSSVLSCMQRIKDDDCTSVGTMGFMITVTDKQIIDNVKYVYVELSFDASRYGRVRDYEYAEV